MTFGKALGLSLDRVDALAKALDWWSDEVVPDESLRAAGLDPAERTVQMLVRLVRQLLRFPRHLSQHVGGFVITETPLCEIVPLQNAAMPERTFIEWDKDDIDARWGYSRWTAWRWGMLTAISKCFRTVAEARRHGGTKARRGFEMTVKTFRDLVAWQKAIVLAKQVYQVTAQLPSSEKFGLISQMRRAAVSIQSNIAEGYGRQSLTEYVRFLKVARGSLMELQTQLILVEELHLTRVPPELSEAQAETDRVLQALIRSLERKQIDHRK